MVLFISLLLVGVVGALIYVFLTWNFDTWRKRGVNGPSPKPLVGNLPNAFTQKRNMVYDFDDIYQQYKKDENFVGIFNCRTPQLLILDPKIAHDIYVTNFKNFHDNEFSQWTDKESDPIFGQNPFLLTGNEWKEKRAEITPALTNNRIKASYPVMQQVCTKLTDFVRRRCESSPKDGQNAKDIAIRFTSETVADCVLGVEAGSFASEKEAPILYNAKKLFEQSTAIMIYTVLVGLLPKLRNIYKVRFVPAAVENFFVNLMKDAVDLRRKSIASDRADFLNYLLELQKKKNLTPLAMTGHTLTFLIDGFETSAATICNFLLLLGRNQGVQDRLRAEILSNLDESGGLTFEKLHELPYLEQCFMETLRLYSPLLVSSKLCTEPCELVNKNGRSLKMRKGDVVNIPVYSLHHDEEFYTKVNEFIPERFSEENGGTKKFKESGMFFPFGDGPRICLGMRFAQVQVKAAVAELVKNFKVTVNPRSRKDDELEPSFFIASLAGGVWLDFAPIKN